MQGVWCGLCRYWGPRAEISDHLWRGFCPNVGVGPDPKIPQTLGTRPLRFGERRPLDATTVRQHSCMRSRILSVEVRMGRKVVRGSEFSGVRKFRITVTIERTLHK